MSNSVPPSLPQSSNRSYESEFARLFDGNLHVFSFWKGRVALYAILKALDIGAGDEVILPGYTCVVVPNAVRFLGAVPIYVDNQPGTFNIDPNRVEGVITDRTRAILVQHTYGIPGPIAEILAIANRHGIPVIEDSAHALGSAINNQKVGTFGKAAFFSSQWSKPYTTGLGGLAVTTDQDLAIKLRQVYSDMVMPPWTDRSKLLFQYKAYNLFFSSHIYWQAQSILHGLSILGLFVGSSGTEELEGMLPEDHNWRMAKSQQRVGLYCIEGIRNDIERRKILTQQYDNRLQEQGWTIAFRSDQTVFLRYPLKVGNKNDLLQRAKYAHIELGSWFETPLHPISLMKHNNFTYTLGQCPNAEKNAQQVVNLPMHRWISTEEADKILDFIVTNAVPLN